MMRNFVKPISVINFNEGNIDKNGFYGVDGTVLYKEAFTDFIGYKDYAIDAEYIALLMMKKYKEEYPEAKISLFWWEDEKFETYMEKHPDEIVEELENAINEYIWELGGNNIAE